MRSRSPNSSKRGERSTATPAPIVLPGVDITQSSVQVMSLGGDTSSTASYTPPALVWKTISDVTLNTWSNGSIVNNTTYPFMFTKDVDGFVHCKGSMTLVVTSGNINGKILNFPAGYRPGGSGAGISGNQWRGIVIHGGSIYAARHDAGGDFGIENAFFSGSYYLTFGTCKWFAEN